MPIVAKVLEKIVATQLSNYLVSNNLLHPHQGAYQHGKSTEDILLVAVDTITSHLDRGNYVCAALERLTLLGLSNSSIDLFHVTRKNTAII